MRRERGGPNGELDAGSKREHLVMSRLEEITARLDVLTRELESGETDDDRASELTREAAELATEALGELERRLRELAPDE
jgi:hypothetical protein